MPHKDKAIRKQFEVFVGQLASTGVAAESDVVGCSDVEIGRLEAKYGLTLPASYRCYLRTMGHAAGRLFTHDHVKASYVDVLRLTERERQRKAPAAERVELPADALVILDRLRDQHLFIR